MTAPRTLIRYAIVLAFVGLISGVLFYMDAVLADLFGGNMAVRHSVHGVAHTAMAVCLGVFLVGLWRSLR